MGFRGYLALRCRVGGQRRPWLQEHSFALHSNKEHGIHGSHSGSVSRAVQQLINLTLVLAGVNWDAGLIAMVPTCWQGPLNA